MDSTDGVDGGGGGVDTRTMRWDASGGTTASLLTFLLYLNDDFAGGETTFFPTRTASALYLASRGGESKEERARRRAEGRTLDPPAPIPVRPVQGSVLCFPQVLDLTFVLKQRVLCVPPTLVYTE